MTDEEMAEEYTTKNGFGSDCNNLTSYDANKEIEQAFLAGLKAGRPQWHKVVDGDLPKRDERFSTNISIAVMIQDNNFAFYCYDDKKWYFQGIEIGNVIAWCEIPKYTEE